MYETYCVPVSVFACLSYPPQICAFHVTLADSYERVRRRGEAGRVCVLHGKTRAFINNVRVYFFLPLRLLNIPLHPLAFFLVLAFTLSLGHMQ